MIVLTFGMNMSTMMHTRQVFSFWDFLADVGGLYDMLFILGGAVVSVFQLLTGSPMNRFIIKHLFKVERKKQSNVHGSDLSSQIKA